MKWFKAWFNKPFGVGDTLRFWLRDIQDDLVEFRMLFDENVLRQCGTCGRPNNSGHKMHCYREYTKANRRG